MQEEYFVKIDRTVIGPITKSALKQLIAEGRVTGESLVRRGRHGKWVQASRTKGFHPVSAADGNATTEESRSSHTMKQSERRVDVDASQFEVTPMHSRSESPTFQRRRPSRPQRLIAATFVGGLLIMLASGIAINWMSESGVNHPDFKRARLESADGRTQVELDLADLIEMSEPAVVRIDTVTRSGSAIGSGFVISSDGLVVTNHHVMEDAIGAVVRFHDGAISEVKGVLFSDEHRDIAVITINTEPLGDLHVLEIAKVLPRKGDRVVALGAPKGLSFSAAEGMVSGVRKGSDILKELGSAPGLGRDLPGTWIQTTTPISSGNSGGPLVDLRGEVVGANTFVLREAQNLNFAISAADIHDAIEQARAASLVTLVDLAKTSDGAITGNVIITDEAISDAANGFLKKLEAEREARLRKLEQLEVSFESAQEALKRAMLDLDTRAQERTRRQIADIGREINDLVDWEIDKAIPKLDPHSPKTGQIGCIAFGRFEVLQVIDKATGWALVTPLTHNRRYGKSVFVQGIELSSIADGDVLTVPRKLLFEVSGTQTYETVVGGTNTVFVFSCIFDLDQLKEDHLSGHRKSGREEPSLTAEERDQIEAKRRMLVTEAWKPLKVRVTDGIDDELQDELRDFSSKFEGLPEAIAARNELDADLKLRRAQQLMVNGTATNGVRTLREIVQDWPDTHAATEALKTLAQVKETWDSLKSKLVDGIDVQLRDELKEFSVKFDGLPEAAAAKNELDAASKLRLAEQLIEKRKTTNGELWLREIIEDWPETHAADEARKALGIDESSSTRQ